MSSPTTPPPGAPILPPPAGTPAFVPQNGMGTAALVMAILQFVCLGPIASVLAIIFGRIGMNKAKQGLATNGGVATASFWLGIAGLILSVIGLLVAVFVIGLGVKVAINSVDPVRNSQTGLADGSYGMHPDSSVRLIDSCALTGDPLNLDTQEMAASGVTVVGRGAAECGAAWAIPDFVTFTVTDGVADIVSVTVVQIK
jgi:uncharacterized membrane protein